MSGITLEKQTLREYTVVLDWGGDLGSCDAPVVQVRASSRMAAWFAALEVAWHDWAGQIDEIPEAADYDEGEASDLWYVVTILDGHAFEAVA